MTLNKLIQNMHRSSFLLGIFVTGLLGWGGSGAGSASANPLPPPVYSAGISVTPGTAADLFSGVEFPLSEISNSDDVEVGYSVSIVGPTEGFGLPGFFNESGLASARQAAVGSAVSLSTTLFGSGPIPVRYETNNTTSAEFRDYLRFSGPPNTTAKLTGAFILEGLAGVGSTDEPNNLSIVVTGASINIGGSTANWQSRADSRGNISCALNIDFVQQDVSCFDLYEPFLQPISVTKSLDFDDDGYAGVPFQLDISTSGRVFATQRCIEGICSTVTAELVNRFSETLFWDGIISLESDAGPIDVSVISSSGFDYRLSARPVNSVTVPGPLPLLGVGAAFGFSRKLRKRIKSSKLPAASAID